MFSIILSGKRENSFKHKYFISFWFVIYVFVVVVIRQKFDADIENYAEYMKLDSLSIYYIKEPIVWLGQRFVYDFLASSYLVFLVFDIVIGIVMFVALRAHNLPYYAYFSFLIYFPVILSMQNIYRQFYAEIFFLLCMSYLNSKRKLGKSVFAFITAVLSHNSAAIFLPYYTNYFNGFAKKVIFHILFVSIAIIGVYFGSGTKSNATTGVRLEIIYVLFFFFTLVIFILSKKLFIKLSELDNYLFLLSTCLVLLTSLNFLSSTSVERLGLFAMIACYPMIVLKLEAISGSAWFSVRVIFTLLGFIPIFFFDTRVLLFSF